MKYVRKSFLLMVLLGIMILSGSVNVNASSGKTYIDKPNVEIKQGCSTIVSLHNPSGSVTWVSKNSNIASVQFMKAFYDKNTKEIVSVAKITAHKSGTINITAMVGKRACTCKVKVNGKQHNTKQSKSKTETIKKGKSIIIKLQKSHKINIYVSNSKIVSIATGKYKNGMRYVKIKGRQVGKTALKIKYKNGKTYNYIINVKS